ncbi:MAG: dTDP-4-dehydrorhamnose 3,5-epimerase [Bacteroidales bacterium]|jgi:dTDP-4-dehydrorhamnose 3,5-epimerase|nr:dTDP-4-dehydrorhamnose 3,5-epimerase [Bacteroidales bacterium]
MEISERKLKGTYEICLNPHVDNRGFFMRTFDESIFKEKGLERKWVQENHSRSEEKGIIRGLHFQLPPFTETKLVRCIKGKILDVFVDLRKDSKTFGMWDSIELSATNKKMIYIPRGFAHGFCTITNESEILYKVDNFYNAKAEVGIIWNDPDIKINWQVDTPVLSLKDKNNLLLKDFIKHFQGIENF